MGETAGGAAKTMGGRAAGKWDDNEQTSAADNGEQTNQPVEETEPPVTTEPDYNELYNDTFIQEMQQFFPIPISKDDIRTIILAEHRDLNQLEQKLTEAMREMMGAGIKQEQLAEFKANLRDSIQAMAIPNELKQLGINMGVPRLKANLLYDHNKTMEEKKKAAEAVEKVIYKKGQFIVQAGQPVTEAQIEMLSELGLLQNHKADIPLIAGTALAVFMSLGIGVIYLIYFERTILYRPLIILMTGSVLVLVAGLTYAAGLFNSYLIPSAMAGMLLAVLVNVRAGMIINTVMALLAGLLTDMQVTPVIMTMIGGMAGISVLKTIQQRNTLVWAGIVVAAVNAAAVFPLMLAQGGWRALYSSFRGVLGGILASVLTIGTLPIWENLFGIVTPIKLVELGSQSTCPKTAASGNPGHLSSCIIVANLAESAAMPSVQTVCWPGWELTITTSANWSGPTFSRKTNCQ